MQTEGTHQLISLEDVALAFDGNKARPLAHVKRMELAPGSLVRVEGAWAHVKIDGYLAPQIAAPIYLCPEGDYQPTKAGVCPIHKVPLEQIQDE
jgi:hypothetical protein